MNKRIYLTFDIETIVTGYSYNPTYWSSVYLGGMYIAHELQKRNLKGTFYISLSPKAKGIAYKDYVECLNMLIESLKSYPNIKIEPHIHAFNLPLNFECKRDEFSEYSYDQQVIMLNWARSFFKERGIDVQNFRPGGYNVNESYYNSLKQTGFKTSSVLLKNDEPNIDLMTNKISQSDPVIKENGIIEYPVTSVLIKSIKGKKEVVNLSPDFFTLESMSPFIKELEYVNINFHSFSVFLNRMTRENHSNQFKNNLNFFFIERFLNKLLKKRSIETINTDTIFRKEFVKWVDFIENNSYDTYFIGE